MAMWVIIKSTSADKVLSPYALNEFIDSSRVCNRFVNATFSLLLASVLKIGVFETMKLVHKNIGILSFSESFFNTMHMSSSSDFDFPGPCRLTNFPRVDSPHILHNSIFASEISSLSNLEIA